MGEVAGHFDPIEVTELSEEDLQPLAIDEEGETGDEGPDVPSEAPVKVKPRAIQTPSITPDADSGSPAQVGPGRTSVLNPQGRLHRRGNDRL